VDKNNQKNCIKNNQYEYFDIIMKIKLKLI